MNIMTKSFRFFCIVVLLVFIREDIFSQFCGTNSIDSIPISEMPWYDNHLFIDSVENNLPPNVFTPDGFESVNRSSGQLPDHISIPVILNFYYDQGTAPVNDELIQQQFDLVNDIYRNNELNIFFYPMCVNHEFDLPGHAHINLIDLPFLPDLSSCLGDNVIEVFVPETAWKNIFLPPPFDCIIIDRLNFFAGSMTFAHELGHKMGLLHHTHFGFGNGNAASTIANDRCILESVDRNRKYSFFDGWGCLATINNFLTNVFNLNNPIKVGKICNKTADGLCDTNADPTLTATIPSNVSRVFVGGESVCFLNDDSLNDPWSDVYNPTANVIDIESFETNAHNLMSYSTDACYSFLSRSQRIIIADKATQYESTIPSRADLYEPDDIGELADRRPLELNSLQTHSIHAIDCATAVYDELPSQVPLPVGVAIELCEARFDPADWLMIDVNMIDPVSRLEIVVSDCGTENNPVDEVLVFTRDGMGNLVQENVLFRNEGGDRIFEIDLDCGAITTDLLVQVVPNEDEAGLYNIELREQDEIVVAGFDQNTICPGDVLSVSGFPAGSTISWTIPSGSGVSISTTSGSSTTVTGIAGGATNYQIEVEINNGGCLRTITKDFDPPLSGSNFSLQELRIGCIGSGDNFENAGIYSISPIPQGGVDWQVSNGTIIHESNHRVFVIPNSLMGVYVTANLVDDCDDSMNVSSSFAVTLCEQFCVDGATITQSLTGCSARVNLTPTQNMQGQYNYFITDAAKLRMMEVKENQTSTLFDIDLSQYTRGDYLLHTFCHNEGYSETGFKVKKDTLCDFSIERLSDCDFTSNANSCPAGTRSFWLSPESDTIRLDTIRNADIDGIWTAVVIGNDGCSIEMDSIHVNNCEIELPTTVCDNINSQSSGSGDWSGTYTSDGNGELHIEFYTASVPDELEVLVNGILLANSGDYSSNLCHPDYGTCIGTVNYGCGNDYIVDIPVSYGDEIDVNVYGNTCGGSYTYWSLTATCSSPNNVSGGNEVAARNRNIDDVDWDGELVVYPNPASEKINVYFQNHKGVNTNIEIFDHSGNVVHSASSNLGFLEVNTQNYLDGLYFVKLNNKRAQRTSKIFIAHK